MDGPRNGRVEGWENPQRLTVFDILNVGTDVSHLFESMIKRIERMYKIQKTVYFSNRYVIFFVVSPSDKDKRTKRTTWWKTVKVLRVPTTRVSA